MRIAKGVKKIEVRCLTKEGLWDSTSVHSKTQKNSTFDDIPLEAEALKKYMAAEFDHEMIYHIKERGGSLFCSFGYCKGMFGVMITPKDGLI